MHGGVRFPPAARAPQVYPLLRTLAVASLVALAITALLAPTAAAAADACQTTVIDMGGLYVVIRTGTPDCAGVELWLECNDIGGWQGPDDPEPDCRIA